MDDTTSDEIAELRRQVAELQRRLDGKEASADAAPAASSRRDMLRLAGAAMAGAIGGSAISAGRAAAVTGDPLLVGLSEDAQNPTILSYTGPTLVAGGAFTAGTGTALAPSAASTAGIVGYVNNGAGRFGVHGISTNAAGGGVIGTATGAGAGVTGRSVAGPDLVAGGTGFLRLGSAGHTVPSIAPQAGDLFRMDDDELFYTVSAGPPLNIVNLIGNVGGLVFLDAPVRAIDTRLNNGPKLEANAARAFSLSTTTSGDTAVPEGSRAAMVTVTVDATEGEGGFLTIYAADVPRPFISSVNWFGPGQIIANTTLTRVVRPTGGINIFAGANRTHAIVDVIAYYR